MIIQRCRRIFLRYFQTLILHVVYALTADTGMIHVTIYLSYCRVFYDFFMINLFKSNFLFRRNFYIAYFFVFHIIFNWRPMLRHWTPVLDLSSFPLIYSMLSRLVIPPPQLTSHTLKVGSQFSFPLSCKDLKESLIDLYLDSRLEQIIILFLRSYNIFTAYLQKAKFTASVDL